MTEIKEADLDFIRKILPKHYNIRSGVRENYIWFRCASPNGISERNKDAAWNDMVMRPLREHFGKRFIEVNHNTCTHHVDFVIYIRYETFMPSDDAVPSGLKNQEEKII